MLSIGFTLSSTLAAATLPYRVQDYFRPWIVLKLVATRLSGGSADRPDLKFADFQINAGMVTAPRQMD